MKKIISGLCILLSFQACMKDTMTRTYTIYKPIYKEKSEVYATVGSSASRAIESPGKIVLSGTYIFLNEIQKGVHIIDNSNPAHPVQKAFINIPGNIDIAVQGNVLYADLYTELAVLDISDPLQARLVKIIPNVFPEQSFANGFATDSLHFIAGWTKKDTTVSIHSDPISYPGGVVFLNNSANQSVLVPGTKSAISGSMARFALIGQYLYTVDNHSLRSFSLSNPLQPQEAANISAGWDIETIYPFNNKLFLGSKEGMFVFDLSNPAKPARQTQFTHGRACDPVIADDNYAYITLRNGTTCGATLNELEVVDISNLSATNLVKTYSLTNPYGLAKDNNLLFICDGTEGIKMFNAADPLNIALKKHIGGLETYDAIAWNKNLIVVAKDGLYQFDYSNPGDLLLKSKLAINH